MAEFLRSVTQTVAFLETAAQAGSLVGDAFQCRLNAERDNILNSMGHVVSLTHAEATEAWSRPT